MLEENGIETRRPKTNCFGLVYRFNHWECAALNKLYCSFEDCKFYKRRDEVDSQWKRGGQEFEN